MCQGELELQGSYRYIMHVIFGFEKEMYDIGINYGYMEIHNHLYGGKELSKMSDAKKIVIDTKDKQQVIDVSNNQNLTFKEEDILGGNDNYSASKAGIVAFSKTLAVEYAKKNININCVSPGFIKTEMTDKINEEFKNNLISKIPSASLGSGEDVSNCVAFLASDMANYINGETIHVNGGMYMA